MASWADRCELRPRISLSLGHYHCVWNQPWFIKENMKRYHTLKRRGWFGNTATSSHELIAILNSQAPIPNLLISGFVWFKRPFALQFIWTIQVRFLRHQGYGAPEVRKCIAISVVILGAELRASHVARDFYVVKRFAMHPRYELHKLSLTCVNV